ncbi:MAG: redoxin domain-containing protein [Planctomycetota bacterium]|nr:redoxin domain-containing protein [Planctomycetota bacterium]
MRQFAARYEEFQARGVELIRVFHSPVTALTDFVSGPQALPFPLLADPQRMAYSAWGVGGGLTALLHPGAWRRARAAAQAGHRPRWRDALRVGIGIRPADFLINPTGHLEQVHYGADFTDSIPVDRALTWLDG